jgi:hypothetical protein
VVKSTGDNFPDGGGIEGELLDPGQVRSSITRRLRLPLAEGQPVASAQVEGLLDVLLEATSSLNAPLSLRGPPSGLPDPMCRRKPHGTRRLRAARYGASGTSAAFSSCSNR